jgi:hypothetical protein
MTIMWELTWFNKVNILRAIMSKLENLWWRDNNYIKKLIIERLSQTTYDFLDIWGVMTDC